MNEHPHTIRPAMLAVLLFCGTLRITGLPWHAAAVIAGILCLTACLIDL